MRLLAEQGDELAALAVRQAADGLRARHAALLEHLRGLDRADARHAQEQIVDLGRQHPLGGALEDVGQLAVARLEVALEPGALDANGVGAGQSGLALARRPRRGLVTEQRLLRRRGGSLALHSHRFARVD